jgi:hypothetical protein
MEKKKKNENEINHIDMGISNANPPPIILKV